jgi:hypothetical protein
VPLGLDINVCTAFVTTLPGGVQKRKVRECVCVRGTHSGEREMRERERGGGGRERTAPHP